MGYSHTFSLINSCLNPRPERLAPWRFPNPPPDPLRIPSGSPPDPLRNPSGSMDMERLCCRRSFLWFREVRRALLKEGRERLPGLRRAHSQGELLAFGLHRLLDLVA